MKTVKKFSIFDNDAISCTRPMCPISKYNNWNIYNVCKNIHIIIIKLALQSFQGSLFLRDPREEYKRAEKGGWYNYIIIFLLNYLPNLKLSRKRSKVMLNGAENSGICFIVVVFCVCVLGWSILGCVEAKSVQKMTQKDERVLTINMNCWDSFS